MTTLWLCCNRRPGLAAAYLREQLVHETVRVGQNADIGGRESLMVHAPSVGDEAVERAMDDLCRRGRLGLDVAKACAQKAREVVPVKRHDEIGLTQQLDLGGIGTLTDRCQMVQPVFCRKTRGIVQRRHDRRSQRLRQFDPVLPRHGFA